MIEKGKTEGEAMDNITGSQFENRELKADGQPSFDYSAVVTLDNNNETEQIDTLDAERRLVFNQNLSYWNKETNMLSLNNYDNGYFKTIVEMGKDAVPMIYDELKQGPTPLVHALDLIFPGVVEYNGFVSLKDACDIWISILKKTGKFS